MRQENPIRGAIRKITRRPGLPTPEGVGGLVPLNPDQKRAFPYVIYKEESNSPLDATLSQATCSALAARASEFPIAIDLGSDGAQVNLVVRTASDNRQEQRAQSAMFLGTKEATRRVVLEDSTVASEADYAQSAHAEAARLVGDFMDSGIYEPFKEYYGGLRWGSDQDRIKRALFVHTSDFDPDFLAQNLTGGHLSNISFHLGMDLSYRETDTWRNIPIEDLLAKYPDLDYRRLADEQYRSTEQGQRLYKQYKELCGSVMAERNKRVEGQVTEEGIIPARPMIPLSRAPIVEALIADEVRLDHPTPKYDFGPWDLTDIILDSDSTYAHERLTATINTRVPQAYRRVWDGPSEFQHKHRLISSVLHAYRTSEDPQHRAILRQDILTILDGYTNGGAIAETMAIEDAEFRARGSQYGSMELPRVKDIVKDIIRVGLVAPDPEIVARVEELVNHYTPENTQALAHPDPLAISRGELMLCVIDSLKLIRVDSSPEVLERVAARVFGDASVSAETRGIVETAIQSMELRNTPDVNKAFLAWRKFGHSYGDEKNPDEVRACEEYDRQLEPSNRLSQEQHQSKNRLILQLLTKLTQSGLAARNPEATYIFLGLVERIDFNKAYEMKALPSEYYELVKIASDPKLGETQRNKILWRFQDQFEYVDSDSTHLLVPVVLDMFQIGLGAPDAVRLPTKETSHGLAAVSSLVYKHGRSMFKSASQEQLAILGQYSTAIREHAQRILTRQVTDGTPQIAVKRKDLVGERQRGMIDYLEDTARELKRIEEYYEEYLHIERVKVYPHEYYPWVLDQMGEFWSHLQYEAREGEARGLFGRLQQVVRNRLVLHENPDQYQEGFDVIGDGHLDELLLVGYEGMVVPHDIKYNNTVWQKGLPWMTQAISHMPETVVQAMVKKYASTHPAFAKYVQEAHARWNERGEVR